MKRSMSLHRIGFCAAPVVRVSAVFATAVLLTNATVAAPQTTLNYPLPGGASILYSDAANPRDPLSERAWTKAVFHFPNGATFGLLPRAGQSNAGGSTQMEPPSNGDVSPSGRYVVVARSEEGTVSTGPGQAESVLSREYCSAIEIRTGCITADQTGEICGAGWQAGQPAQWGTDDQTAMMLRSDRPSASRVLNFIRVGQPPRDVVGDDSGADNLLRCNPPSPANREAYLKIAAALRVAGAQGDSQLIDHALSKSAGSSTATPAPSTSNVAQRGATGSVQNRSEIEFANHARLVYSAPVAPDLSRTFGPGWTRLTITRPDGKTLPIIPDEPLTAEGGIIFSTAGSNARSHDGRYFVLDLTRNGMTETEDGKPTVASREFCPILDTQTGCVARDYTGAVCGGKWDEKDAIWRSRLDSGKADSQSMTTLDKLTAQAVWTQFSKSNSTDIKPFVRVALGIENLRACDPPGAESAAYYAEIKTALGAAANAESAPATGGATPANADEPPTWTVQVDRAWLYERPSVGSSRHGYLIRGDHVAVIGEEKPNWVRTRYTRAGKAPLEAWMKRQDIVSAN